MPTKRRAPSGDDRGGPRKRRESAVTPVKQRETSVFTKLLQEAGLTLNNRQKLHEISVNQAVFQRNVDQQLRKHEHKNDKIQEDFIDGFSKYIDDPERFKSSLMLTQPSADSDSHTQSQESLVRLLLGVDRIQPRVIDILVQKLVHADSQGDVFTQAGVSVDVPRLIMSQLRWLEHILQPEDLISKLFELLGIVSGEVQREIISCLPEIVDDANHVTVGRQLIDLYNDNSELAVPVLDALSNLSLPDDVISDVRTSVTENLESIRLEDVPVAVKFLLQTATSKNAAEVVSELRRHLDLTATFPPGEASTPEKGKSLNRYEKESSEALTFRAIESACSKHVEDAWIKEISEVKSDHRVLDLVVLFQQYSSPPRRRVVEGLVRSKVRHGAFTDVLLQAVFASFSKVLSSKMPAILALAKVLLKSPEPSVSAFACCMYRMAFTTTDSYNQQEVVSQLIGHVGSGVGVEADAALDVLSDLVDSAIDKIKRFDVFVKSLLYYIDNYSLEQVRKLYYVISQLGVHSGDDGRGIQDDVHIMLRKQLSSSDAKYRRMGVIGAVMVVKATAAHSNSSLLSADGSSLDATLSEEAFNQCISLLQLVRSSCRDVPEAMGLFLDELANAMQKSTFSSKIDEWISDNIVGEFENDYVADYEPVSESSECLIPYENLFPLDDVSEGNDITVPVVPLVVKSLKVVKKRESGRLISPLCLSPEFRLLRVCEQRQHEGDLNDIGATLGCPVQLPAMHLYDKLSSLSATEKQIIASSLFTCINWFIETVNAFSTQDDPEMKAKVLSRLQNITQLRKLLNKCLSATQGYQPPLATFYSDPSPPPAAPAAQEKKPRGSRKRKKAAEPDEVTEDCDVSSDDVTRMGDGTEKTQTTQKPAEKAEMTSVAGGSVDISGYREYFRELDVCVFTTLRCDVSQVQLDTEFEPKTPQKLSLGAEQLEYLLTDLAHKLEHALLSNAPKRKTFLKKKVTSCYLQLDQSPPGVIAHRAVKLLPTLCDQLERTAGFFQTLVDQNDGLVDGPGSRSQEAQLMASCYHYLLQCMLTLFSWTGFTHTEHAPLLKQMLLSVSSRKSSSSATQIPHASSVRYCFAYFEELSGTVPSIKCAVMLARLLCVVRDKSQSKPAYQEKIAALCKGFLQREWQNVEGEREKGPEFNEAILTLLRLYLENVKDRMEAIEHIAGDGMSELSDAEKNGHSESYPTLNRSTQPVFFKVLMSELVETIKTYGATKQNDSYETKRSALLEWNIAVRIFHTLVSLCKVFDSRTNLITVLKVGRQFVELFLKLGMPVLDSLFRQFREDIQALLKSLQLSTRHLQHVCNHSKHVKDISLTNQVPLVKKTLEAFVYRVKAMLSVNQCLEAFWMGNLKNRTLHGEEIPSQATTAAEDESDRNSTVAESRHSDSEGDGDAGDQAETSSDEESIVNPRDSQNPSMSKEW